MSLPTNNKKTGNKTGKNQPGVNNGSKFIKANSKPGGAKQKVRSTGANRGSQILKCIVFLQNNLKK